MNCLPPDLRKECEWFGLQGFIKHYNELCGTAYQLDKCLDVNNPPSRPQPEVLVSSKESPGMVIERKSIVPREFANAHKKQHKKAESLLSALSQQLDPFLQDACYFLELDESEIDVRKDEGMTTIAKMIADAVILARTNGKDGQLNGKIPIRWVLGADRDDEGMSRGLTKVVTCTPCNLLDPTYQEKALEDGKNELENQLKKTPRKFAEYESYVKTVVVEFFGEHFSKEQVEEMISRIVLPLGIDQVWMAYDDPISDHECHKRYHKIYPVSRSLDQGLVLK